MKDQNHRPMRNLAINPERLWDEIMETATIGDTAKGGICRLTLTDLDRQVRDWFRARAKAFGCTVTVDDMGVMFARRAGQRADLPPIAMGSHLDTQPTGGKFDGVLGVLAALEALRTMHRGGLRDLRPDRSRQLHQRRRIALCAGDDRVRRVRRRVRARLGGGAEGPRRRHLRRGAGSDRLSRRRALRRASALGVFRTAYRAGADPGGRRQGDRHRHRRAGRALVRSHITGQRRIPARRRCACARTRWSAPRA